MDKLLIKEIEFIGHCGITDDERNAGQRLSADVELYADITKAAESDQLVDAIDYVSVCNLIISVGCSGKFNLLETLVEKMAREVLSKYDVSEVVIRLRKCSVPVTPIRGYFEVEIRRIRR